MIQWNSYLEVHHWIVRCIYFSLKKIGSSLCCFSGWGARNQGSPLCVIPFLWCWTFTACQLMAFKLASFQILADFSSLIAPLGHLLRRPIYFKRKLDTAIKERHVNHTHSLKLSISVYDPSGLFITDAGFFWKAVLLGNKNLWLQNLISFTSFFLQKH